ncbi:MULTISPECIES: SPFH domain-containing protein [unclassified Polaromonas]|uniref:SPFH domain-containing protein n=1 Tax=unclassified Polaromonas TaxID=2638319 RepID=UPI001E574E3D|nr:MULTISPECIES: SPFH domain-containing protein [unclassified Polaromonas]
MSLLHLIKNGAQLIVRESQQVQFVAAGQYADLFNPGKQAQPEHGKRVAAARGRAGHRQALQLGRDRQPERLGSATPTARTASSLWATATPAPWPANSPTAG